MVSGIILFAFVAYNFSWWGYCGWGWAGAFKGFMLTVILSILLANALGPSPHFIQGWMK